MSAPRIPPKGYSIPRLPQSAANDSAQVHCQKCGSTAHWSYECPAATNTVSNGSSSATTQTSKQAPPKLSRTQMLKLGIQRPLREVAPPKSERELFNEQCRETERVLAELEGEPPKQRRRTETTAAEVKKEVKKEEEEELPTVTIKIEKRDEDEGHHHHLHDTREHRQKLQTLNRL